MTRQLIVRREPVFFRFRLGFPSGRTGSRTAARSTGTRRVIQPQRFGKAVCPDPGPIGEKSGTRLRSDRFCDDFDVDIAAGRFGIGAEFMGGVRQFFRLFLGDAPDFHFQDNADFIPVVFLIF